MIVRAPENERHHERAIENSEVFSAQAGLYVPVSQLVDSVDTVYQDALLRRIIRMPTILVQPYPAPGVMTADAFNNVREKISQIELPAGYKLIWYGEYKA